MLPFEPLEVYPFMQANLPISTGVYAIVNRLNDKFYIGSAKSVNQLPSKCGFRTRFYDHRSRLRRNDHHSKHLQRSYNYYVGELGMDPDYVYEVWILELVEPELCFDVEQYYLDNYDYDYNESSIARTTNSQKGRKLDKEMCERRAAKLRGVPHTDERKHNISEAKKNSPKTKEAAIRIADLKARDFVGISPTGEVVYFRNAKKFGRNNNLDGSSILACAKGKSAGKNRLQHKGWKFYYKEDYDSLNGVMPERENRALSSFVAISPTGKIIFFTNANQFVRDYPQWGFRSSGISNCANGGQTVHKGWQFFYREDYESIGGDVTIVEDKKLKSYLAISPEGDRIYFTNAQQFIRDHPNYKFNPNCISACLKGRNSFHIGWKFSYADEYDERLLA